MFDLPLIVEDYPKDYEGFKFVTVLFFHKENTILMIVDNISDGKISGYVLDNMSEVEEKVLLNYAEQWFKNKNEPFSVFLTKQSKNNFSNFYRIFDIDNIIKSVGPLPNYKQKIISTQRKKLLTSNK